VQLVERNCDCCTSQAELGFAGHADIRDIDTDVYAPDGLCRSINQYGRLIRSKKWLDDFVEWDLWDCYPSLRADGRCSGEIGGT